MDRHKIEPEIITVSGTFKLMISDCPTYDEEIPLLFEIDRIEPHIKAEQYVLLFHIKNPVKSDFKEYKRVSFLFDEDGESFFIAYRYLQAILTEDYFLLDLYSIGELNPFYNIGYTFDL